MNHFLFLVSILAFGFTARATEPRNRVEELFIWKISDEMKLAVPEEKMLSQALRRLNQKRAKANGALQENLKKMNQVKSSKEREKLLQEHRQLLKSYHELSLEELDLVEKILGPDRTSRYLILKNDLTARLKNLLATPGDKPVSAPLPPPQVIEEK